MRRKGGNDRRDRRSQGRPSSQSAAERSDLVYGKRPVEELLKRHPGDVLELRVTEESHAWLREVQSPNGVLVVKVVSRTELDDQTEGGNHQGVVALVKPFRALDEGALIKTLGADSTVPSLVVIAEELTDPRNLGSVLRVCDGAGVAAVFITERRASPITAVVRRASAGAAEVLPIAYVGNVQRTLDALKKAGYWIVGTDLAEGSQNVYSSELPLRIAVVFGAEGKGLRDLTRRNCDFRILLPMYGVLQSLNVSTAAAAILFELAQRTRR